MWSIGGYRRCMSGMCLVWSLGGYRNVFGH